MLAAWALVMCGRRVCRMASAAASEPGCCWSVPAVIVVSVVVGAVGHLRVRNAALARGAPQVEALVLEVAEAVGAGVDDAVAGHSPLPCCRSASQRSKSPASRSR